MQMPDILSQDEIDALLSATETETPEGESIGTTVETKSTATKPIITYDFKHPNRVGTGSVM